MAVVKEEEKPEVVKATMKSSVTGLRETIDIFHCRLTNGTMVEIRFINGMFGGVRFDLKNPYTKKQWVDLGSVTILIDHFEKLIKKERELCKRKISTLEKIPLRATDGSGE